MESKALFEVETAWPFPILQYTTNTSFVEVRKASGIAYILLQLISSLENNNEKLVAMLKGLGVPHDIHYIFAGELASMINLGIIQMQSGKEFGTELIGIYRVSDFEITKLGKQLFKEGAIPTGNDKVKKLYTYYDVSRKDTLIKFDRKLFRLDNSTLDENCVGDVVLTDSDIEMFINENMNQYAFRKGERISGFEHEPPEFLVYKMDDAVVLRILEDGVQIQAKDKEQDAFIHKFYNADTVTRLDNSTLDENCVGDVVLTDSDIEMFINENMNQYAFRKGERISGFEHEPPEFLVYKMDDAVVLRILEDGVQIQAKDKEQDAFIHKFYNADTVTRQYVMTPTL